MARTTSWTKIEFELHLKNDNCIEFELQVLTEEAEVCIAQVKKQLFGFSLSEIAKISHGDFKIGKQDILVRKTDVSHLMITSKSQEVTSLGS